MNSIPVHIRHSELFGSLADDEVREILAACRPVDIKSGAHACRQGEPGDSMFVIVRGRVSINLEEGGTLRLLNHLGPGDHFGEMSLLLGGSRSANVTAMMDTEVLELTRPDFERTISRVPGFAANLSRSLGGWLRGQIAGGSRPERKQVALVRGCPAAAGMASQLAAFVAADGGAIEVISDQRPRQAVDNWRTIPTDKNFESELLQRIAAAVASEQRVLVDIDQSRATARILMQHEMVWWVAENDPDGETDSLCSLRQLLTAAPQLTSRIQRVETLPKSDKLQPPGAPDYEAAASEQPRPPLRVQYTGEPTHAEFVPRDVVRLTRNMRGIQVGLALGGGGARGIAHIGVLEVCEREGIYFDRIAGTSAGAIVAAAYAAGIPLAQIREVFEKEMTPPRSLAWLPKAPQWYMLGVFRLGLAEIKFRRYLHDYSFDQLLTPAQLVTVDLVSGEHRIRSAGDVTNAVLESINHPVFGRPILRDGEALVDGGVLMNVPVTALRQQEVDVSVAVDVSKQLSCEFAGNTKSTPTAKMRRPGYFSTLLRVTDVELTNLAALHGAQCDYLIAPPTADYPFDDFTQAAGLVEAGRQGAEAALPGLRKVLDDAVGWNRSQPATPISAAIHRAA